MFKYLGRWLYENIRCTRHNILHLSMFKVSFNGRYWRVRDRDGVTMLFPIYPYMAFMEIEGYLRHGKWKFEPGMTVIDVGSCYAEYALYAAKKIGPTGRLLLLEPDAENMRITREVFAINNCTGDNVHMISSGLWKTAGAIHFAEGIGGASCIIESPEQLPAGAQLKSIEVESLASLAQKYNLSRIDMIKIDIEGAELEVIEAAREVMQRFKPCFAIASYHIRESKPTSEALEPMFRDFGYAVETGFPQHPTTWAGPSL